MLVNAKFVNDAVPVPPTSAATCKSAEPASSAHSSGLRPNTNRQMLNQTTLIHNRIATDKS
jgi:hypothetical protein